MVEHYYLHRRHCFQKNGLHLPTRRQKWNTTGRRSCCTRHPNARNCRRRRGNLLDLMLCGGLWRVLCISPWRLVYALARPN